MSKGSARRNEDTQKVRDNWDAIFNKKEKPTACPRCGAEDYDSVKTKLGHGDPSETYCLCIHCDEAFDGKTIWD